MENQCHGEAEAVLNLQPNSSISIAYHSLYGPHDDLILLELDDKILPDVIHQRVTLRGQPNEDAVLCTESKTYAVKFVGTSNSVYLIQPSNSQSSLHENPQDCGAKIDDRRVANVIKMAPGHMELVEVAPRLDKLRVLLSANPYTSADDIAMYDKEEKEQVSYKWEDLVNEIQASDEELRSGLSALSAVEIDGCWRIVDDKYMDMMLRMLMNNSVLNEWSLNALNEGEVLATLESDGFPSKLAQHCLRVYGTKVDGDHIWKLDEKRVCVHFARQILKDGKKKLETFMAEWARKVPDGFEASFDMLEGEVVTEKLGVETWVRAFSVSLLPSNPPDRFKALFKERAKWEGKDLEPYIRDLKVPGLSSEGLLLKYTRRIQPSLDADPIFSKR